MTPHPIAALLRKIRTDAGLSLDQAAKRTGMASAVIGSYERGDRRASLEQVDRVLGPYGYRLTVEPIAERGGAT